MEIIGSSVVRSDARDKALGRACYVADIQVPGAWVGGTVRSPVASGRIRRIVFEDSFDLSRVAVVTANDLPGPNVVTMIRDDQPILAHERVRYVCEPIVLIAAPDPATLADALRAVHVEIEEEPAVLSIEEALEADRIVGGEANILAEYRVDAGDPAAGFSQADRIVERCYRTAWQEHLYLETNGMLALPRPTGGVDLIGSLQCPYYIQRALETALALPSESISVKQAVTGGAFGGKEDFPSLIAIHAALLALRSGHPVRMIYDRTEDILATTKRHPSRVDHRTAVLRDGTILAAEIDLVLDGGAYTTLSPVVLSRSLLHATGVYRIPNVSIRGRVVATNRPPNGAFRGFGAPQSLFAIERQIDAIALGLGLSPLEIRRKNLLRDGDSLPFGQRLSSQVGASLVLERAVALSGYEERKASPKQTDRAVQRGIGLSVYLHGAGFTGAGEEMMAGKVAVRFTELGQVEILTSNVEMGQGAETVLSMIAAEALDLPLERIRFAVPDTGMVPDSGPTVASRTTMVVGRILIDACADLLSKLEGGQPRSGNEFLEAAARHVSAVGPLLGEAVYRPPAGLQWDEEQHRGDAYKAYSWGADVVEVEIDTTTLEVRPVRATIVVEIGKAIHPVLARGQIIGGTLQALAYGYMEEIKTEGGRLLNDRMATYIIPTILDAPEIEVAIEEIPCGFGAYGAKGIGELPMDGGAPALAAAIDDALGCFTSSIPMTPEKILEETDADRL